MTREFCSGGLLVDRGTPYPCTQEDLDSYRRFSRGHRQHFKPVSSKTAVRQLLGFLNSEPSSEVRSALRRLKKGIDMRNKAPDIVIKAFRDLDIVFFNGALSGNVVVYVSLISGWIFPHMNAV